MNSTKPISTKKRYIYIDILRILSSFLIVSVHVSALNWEDISVTTSQWQTMNFYDCLSILGVPLFFMISGALFLDTQYSLSFKELFLSKILRLFLIYHFWLLAYNVVPFFQGELAFDFVTIKDELFLKTLLGKGIYHLWFLPQLILLYLISPILREAFQKKTITQYFLLLFVITGALLPTTFAYDYPYRTIVQSYYNRTDLVLMTGYVGYFVLGHYLHTHMTNPLSRKKIAGLIVIAAACMAIVILACSNDALIKDKPSVLLNNPLMLPQFISCGALFIVIKQIPFKQGRLTALVAKLSIYTMGIYLLHPMVLNILAALQVSTLIIHPIVTIPLLTLLVYLISLLITRILFFIPIVNKWLL